MKYIVTGGAGFIGSHVVDLLVDYGHEVVIFDDMSTGKEENINSKALFVNVDISDTVQMINVQKHFLHTDGIFHLAARARIQPSFADPHAYFQSNVLGTYHVLGFAQQYKVRRVVYSASSSAYGDTELPAKEGAKVTPQATNPYSSTKRMGEMLMKDFGTLTGSVETVCLRYFNVYGPRQNKHTDGPYPTVIGLFLGLLENGKPLTIVPDGFQRRDYTWVGDIAKANLLAMQSGKVGAGEIINIGAGKNYSMWDVARMLLGLPSDIAPEQLVASGNCELIAARKGEARETLADISLAKELLGYQPTVVFENGLRALKESNTKVIP